MENCFSISFIGKDFMPVFAGGKADFSAFVGALADVARFSGRTPRPGAAVAANWAGGGCSGAHPTGSPPLGSAENGVEQSLCPQSVRTFS